MYSSSSNGEAVALLRGRGREGVRWISGAEDVRAADRRRARPAVGAGERRPRRELIRADQKPAVILENSQGCWSVPLQVSVVPPPGQGRSRFTDQNVKRTRPLALAQSRILVQVAVEVSSFWSRSEERRVGKGRRVRREAVEVKEQESGCR